LYLWISQNLSKGMGNELKKRRGKGEWGREEQERREEKRRTGADERKIRSFD